MYGHDLGITGEEEEKNQHFEKQNKKASSGGRGELQSSKKNVHACQKLAIKEGRRRRRMRTYASLSILGHTLKGVTDDSMVEGGVIPPPLSLLQNILITYDVWGREDHWLSITSHGEN